MIDIVVNHGSVKPTILFGYIYIHIYICSNKKGIAQVPTLIGKMMIKHEIEWLSPNFQTNPSVTMLATQSSCSLQRETEAFQSFTLQSCEANVHQTFSEN